MALVSQLWTQHCVCGWADLTDSDDGLVTRALLHESIDTRSHLVTTVRVR